MSRCMRTVSTLLPFAVFLTMAACGPSSPEGKVAQIRAGYKIELNSWRPKPEEPPPAMEDEAAAGEDADAAAMEAAAADVEGEEGEAEAVEMGPKPTDILLDLVVYFRGRESLPGVTVDITHADASQAPKQTYHHYVETAGILNGETRQASVVLEDVPFEEGDVFSVELVAGIPADLSAYKEFSESSP